MTEAAQAASSRPPRPWRSLAGAVAVVLLVIFASAALKGWRDYQRAQERERALESEIAATQDRITALQRKIERLQSDPTTLDRVAREELGWVQPNEVVVVLPEQKPAH
jgi:cell division protein FtsB